MCKQESEARTRSGGFSLMELMVVIAILGILVTLVAQNVMPMIMKSNVTAAKTDISTLKNAVINYKMVHNRLPDTLQMLSQPDPDNFDQPYIDADYEPVDPWGTPYVYEPQGSKFIIRSYGADLVPGGDAEDADINSNELKKKKN